MEGYQKTDLTLYTYFRSSTSWRVRIVLHHKKIGVQFKYIKLSTGEQRSQQFGKVNPNQGVPALVLSNGDVLVQSMAICEYLQEVYPDHPLLPKDPAQKAKIRGFCQVINSAIHPYQNLRMLNRVEKEGVDKMKFAAEWVYKGTQTIQKFLAKSKGKYCFGDEVTLADAFFYPHLVGGIARFGIQIDEFPSCKEVLKNLQELEQFRKAEPKNQPDFQG